MPDAPWGPITREGRNEFQLLIALMCVLTGFAQAVLKEVPPSMRDLSPFYQALWSYSLLVGGTFILISAAWRKAVGLSPFLEIGGLLIVGGACLAFGTNTILNADSAGSTFGGPIILVVAFACLSRTARVIHAVWPRSKPKEEKLRDAVRNQLVREAEKAADQIVENRSGNTGSLPVVMSKKDDGEEKP